ncbi:hypothetical protein V1477_008495 [Vespula maculifrons]|uniref:Uncharacterized protein n=1 Tax=Vespula maculifrons TaxID=7453 RepID=A0ABD2CD62_VESMC
MVRTLRKMKRSGGDGLPLVKRYKAADFGNGPVLSRISTSPNLSPRSTHAPENETGWRGWSATRRRYKAAAFDSRSSHATNFHHTHMNPHGTHAPQNETEWWGWSATREEI